MLGSRAWESQGAGKEACRKDSFILEITGRGAQATISCRDGTLRKGLGDTCFKLKSGCVSLLKNYNRKQISNSTVWQVLPQTGATVNRCDP